MVIKNCYMGAFLSNLLHHFYTISVKTFMALYGVSFALESATP